MLRQRRTCSGVSAASLACADTARSVGFGPLCAERAGLLPLAHVLEVALDLGYCNAGYIHGLQNGL
jgi:hypothetical protein